MVRTEVVCIELSGMKRHRKWTESEDEILREHYCIEGRDVVKRIPDRTLSSCFSRAQKLGLAWDRDIGIVGCRFGKLVVIERSGTNAANFAMYRCKCDCGKEHIAAARYLKEGRIQSCGCLTTGRKMVSPDFAAFNSLYSTYRYSASKRGYDFSLTKYEFRDLTSGDCFYCGAQPSLTERIRGTSSAYKYNGIDRLNNHLGYVINNCVSCCNTCNKAKRVSGAVDFIQWAIRLSDKWRGDEEALELLEIRCKA